MVRRMRRLFYVLGIVFVVLIVGIGGLVGFAAYRGAGLDAESKDYVDQAVVDIGQKWDKTELLKRASPNLLRAVSSEQIATLFDELARFGKLTHYSSATGQSLIKVGTDAGVSAHYIANATFENGPARFRIDLIKIADRWMIEGFYVDLSPPGKNVDTKTL
jgi:hypothetical protein